MLLKGIKFVDPSQNSKATKKQNSKLNKVETDQNEQQDIGTCSDRTSLEYPATLKNAINDEKRNEVSKLLSKPVLEREEWMLGDFPTTLGKEYISRDRQRRIKNDKDRQLQLRTSAVIVASRELNPYYRDNGSGLPPEQSSSNSEDELIGPRPPTEQKIRFSDVTVGDGGLHWKKRQRRRQFEIDKHLKESIMINKEPNEITRKSADLHGDFETIVPEQDSEDLNMQVSRIIKKQLESSREISSMHSEDPKNSVLLKKGYKKSEQNAIKELYKQTKINKDDFNYDHEYFRYASKRRLNDDDFGDDFVLKDGSNKSKKKHSDKRELYQKNYNDQQSVKKCLFCIQDTHSKKKRDKTLISESPQAYVCFQSFKQCASPIHLFISPIAHISSSVALDESCYTEIRNYQKSIIRCLDEMNMCVVFVETVSRIVSYEKSLLGGGNHLSIDCFGLPSSLFEDAKIYFRKALEDVESEWSQHKKVITVPKRNDGCRNAVPMNFPYIYVDFSLDGGLLHIIEDNDFPHRICRSVIQGILQMDALETYYKDQLEFENAIKKFKNTFTAYDWTRFV